MSPRTPKLSEFRSRFANAARRREIGAVLALSMAIGSAELQPSARSEDYLAARGGPVAMQVCCAVAGKPLTVERVDECLSVDSVGCTLGDVERAARQLGFTTAAVRWTSDLPPADSPPAVIPVVTRASRRHFIAMLARRGDYLLVADVPHPPRWVSFADLRGQMHWEGEAMHIAENESLLAAIRVRLDEGGRRRTAVLIGTAFVSLCAICAAVLTLIRRSLLPPWSKVLH